MLPKCARAFRLAFAHSCQKNETFCWRGLMLFSVLYLAHTKNDLCKANKALEWTLGIL